MDEMILKDLKKFLKQRGIKTEVARHFGTWQIAKCYMKPTKLLKVGHFYFISNGILQPLSDTWVASTPPKRPSFSIADPEYRKKFYEYLASIEEPKWGKWKHKKTKYREKFF